MLAAAVHGNCREKIMKKGIQQRNVPAFLWVFLLLLTAGCAPDLVRTDFQDLHELPQDPHAYLDPATASLPLIPFHQQQRQAEGFLERHFAAWHTSLPLETTRHPFWAVEWIQNHEVFGANLRPAGSQQIQALIRQADRGSYPSLDRRAITIRHTSLRALPTHRPFFNDPQQAGEGFPFDNLQHSTLPANTPLHVVHRSKDGSWAFVETTLVYGWMPIQDLAWTDHDFIRAFQTGQYLTLNHDDLPIFDLKGTYRFSSRIGMLLPLRETLSGQYRVLVATANAERVAELTEAGIPLLQGMPFPATLTAETLADLAERMMGQLYGWGGSFGGRDCSATVRDLFAPFGVWLPRNSSRQAAVGRVIPLDKLLPRQREKQLLEQGVPLLTLVRLPGHIMLYLGKHRERAVLLHSIWGLRTKTLFGEEGRWIAGRTVITTLEPGQERKGMGFDVSRLLTSVGSMNILVPVGRSGDTIKINDSTAD